MRREMTGGDVSIFGNVTRVLAEAFVDARGGNLRLIGQVAGVTGGALRLEQVAEDIDRRMRPDACDVGAHETAHQD